MPRRRPGWCARIAELSVELGSTQAVLDRLDVERAAKDAAAKAAGERAQAEIASAVAAANRLLGEEESYRKWRDVPLQVPEWVDGRGWPEPDGPSPDPYDCVGCEALFGPAAWAMTS